MEDSASTVQGFMADSPSERARRRLTDEMKKQHLSQRDLAGLLNWSQSKVSKLLKGRSDLGVDDLFELCFAVSLSPLEALRDRGLEFYAEMTPTELRVLEQLRAMSQAERDAFLVLLRARVGPSEAPSATARRPILGKPRRRD